jgi:hypothetical protein
MLVQHTGVLGRREMMFINGTIDRIYETPGALVSMRELVYFSKLLGIMG